ncbi:MAG: aldehyde dehydrogenase family protein [Verrucomicrobiota bacterium]
MNRPGQNRTPVPISFENEETELRCLVNQAMAHARAAQPGWAATCVTHRLRLIRQLRRLIADQAFDLADASASARRRPALEALTAEIMPLVEACRFLEREAKRLLAPRQFGSRGRPLWLAGVRSEIQREPFGVVLIIGPGNYPLLLTGVQMLQALVAGNAVLIKPGVGGTPAMRLLCELAVRAGFARQLIGLLPESTASARAAIAAGPDKVLFTGSAATGRTILAELVPKLIPSTMELSGCDAAIVCADADLDLAAEALTFGLTLNGGATCMSPKRVFVARSIATELEGRLSRAFNFGSSRGIVDPPSQQGAPSTLAAADSLRSAISDALARGAHFIVGGVAADGGVQLPAVLGGVHQNSRLLQEDHFAPVLSLVTVGDEQEAVALTNHCPFALTVSIFSKDEAKARVLASRVSAGVVTVNDLILPTADARLPFGGRRASGFGVTRGVEGLLELTTPKVITRTRGKFRPAFKPAQPGDAALFQAYLKLSHSEDLKTRWHALVSLIRALCNRRNEKL